MRNRFKHIITALLIGVFGVSFAQNMTLVVPSNFVISGNTYTMKNGDEIQFYYDSSNTKLAFVTSQVWTGNDLTFILPRNTATSGQNGYNSGQHLYLKIFDKLNNCKIIYNAAFTKKNNTGLNTFVPGRVDTLTIVNLEIYDLSILGSDTLCTSDTVQLQGGGSLIDPYPPYGKISINPSVGLNLSGNKVIYQGSSAGSYLVSLDYRDYCVVGNNISITILPPISISNSDLLLTPNACGTNNGAIQLLKPASAYEPVNFTFSQNNTVLNKNTLGVLSGLFDGAYNVKIEDKYGCLDSSTINLICATAPPDMKLTIPNVFNFQGYAVKNLDLIEIYYDSLGQKLKLLTSQYWQGTDLVFNLPANYATTGKNGFYDGDKIYIKLFDEVGNCRHEVASLETDISSTGVFMAGSNQIATVISGAMGKIAYSQDTICTGVALMQFTGNNHPYTLVTYSSDVSGLDLANNGNVEYQNSTPGTYQITANTSVCLLNKITPITILPQWSLALANMLLTPNTCGQTNGSIKLVPPSNSYPPLVYTFLSSSYSYTGSIDSIANIGNENFNVSITDRYQCVGKGKVVVNCIAPSLDMIFTISNNYSLQNYVMNVGDEVEIYYDSLGVKLALAARAFWNNADIIFTLPLNTASVGKNGFNEGDLIYAKIVDSQKKCRVQVFSINVANNAATFVSGASVVTDVVSGDLAHVSYLQDTLCTGISKPKISNFTDPYSPIPQFESLPVGLGFLSDGSIDYLTSTPGSYNIKINHPTCFYQNGTIPFYVLPPITLTSQNVLVKENECGQSNAVLKIIAPSQAFAPVTYSFVKRGNTKGYSGTIDTLGGVDDGQYFIKIIDRYLCEGSITTSFTCIPSPTLTTNISNNDYILTDLSPNNASILIDCNKTITVLNSKGKLVNTLLPNTLWAGTDSSGNSLPTGLYIIYCDKKRVGEVTIIR